MLLLDLEVNLVELLPQSTLSGYRLMIGERASAHPVRRCRCGIFPLTLWHSFLYTYGSQHSLFPVPYCVIQADQILKTKPGPAGSREYEWIGNSNIGPARGHKPHASVLVAVVHTLFTPLPPLGCQLQRLPTERVERMSYAETWSRIARLRCICS